MTKMTDIKLEMQGSDAGSDSNPKPTPNVKPNATQLIDAQTHQPLENNQLQISFSSQVSSAPVFSIATPAVTTQAINNSINDTSFLLQDNSLNAQQSNLNLNIESDDNHSKDIKQENKNLLLQQTSVSKPTENISFAEQQTKQKVFEDCQLLNAAEQEGNSDESGGDSKVSSKKCMKDDIKRMNTKKVFKLDAKSKLEKSRQSARECRARKKLRYQYLEDLVCNREKAVVKLRNEFAMFCDLSKKIEAGTLTEDEKKIVLSKTK